MPSVLSGTGPAALPADAHPVDDEMQRSEFDRAAQEVFVMMHWYGTGGSWWAATLMWVGMIAVWALIIWAIYPMLVGESRRKVGESPDRARRSLDERLARGEIDTDEYHSLLEALTSNNHTPTSVGGPR